MDDVATLTSTDGALAEFADDIGADDPVAVVGSRTRWELGGPSTPGTRLVTAPSGIVSYSPQEMTVQVRAGCSTAELRDELAAHGQRTALPERGGTVGGAIAVGQNHPEVLGRGPLRASVLQVRYVSADGRIVNGGGPTVKNVTGFDLPRLMVGSLGTLGLVAEVILRTNPIPPVATWLRADDADPFDVRDALIAPGAIYWDGQQTWVLLEGHAPDVAAQQRVLDAHGAFDVVAGPPVMPSERWSVAASDLRQIDTATTGSFVAAVGVGLIFAEHPQPVRTLSRSVRELTDRMKYNFDPTGRLNPGRDAGLSS
ncbi:MAG: FAD-binding protein [Ilumatobacteraceae bacterium]